MELLKMYPPHKDSPSTYLAGDVNTDDIYIIVGSAEVLPQTVPFPLTIGFDKSYTETVIVTDLGNGNNQLTVKRGSQPLAWIAGTKCARVFTADDLYSLQENIGVIAERIKKKTVNIIMSASEPVNWEDGEWWYEELTETEPVSESELEIKTTAYDGSKPFHIDINGVTETMLNTTGDEATATADDLIII